MGKEFLSEAAEAVSGAGQGAISQANWKMPAPVGKIPAKVVGQSLQDARVGSGTGQQYRASGQRGRGPVADGRGEPPEQTQVKAPVWQ